MIDLAYWAAQFWNPREITHADLGYLRERPGADGFRAPRFDPASDIAQGGTGRKERR